MRALYSLCLLVIPSLVYSLTFGPPNKQPVTGSSGGYSSSRQALTRASSATPRGNGRANRTGTQEQGEKKKEQAGDTESERARAQDLYRAAIEAYSHDDYERVLTLATAGLKIDEKINSALGMAYGLNLVGKVYYKRGDYERARAYYLRGLKAAEEARSLFGMGNNLSSVGSSYYRQGNYRLAQDYYERSLNVRRELGDKDEIARALNDLANVAQSLGAYPKSLELREEALRLWKETGNNIGIADVLNDIGWVYDELGDYARALDHIGRSVTISRDMNMQWGLADGIEGIGFIYLKQGKYRESLAQLREAESLFRKLNNLDEVARTSEHIGEALYQLGDYGGAEAALEQSLAIRKSILGEEHPGVASCLRNLAALYEDKGDYKEAETSYRHALTIHEKGLGPNHPQVALSLIKLASLSLAGGQVAEAAELLTRANDIREHNISLILGMGSERQKLLYMDLFSGETDFTISLHSGYAPTDMRATRLALTTILRRKGRALDAMVDQISSVRRRLNPRDQTLLDELSAMRSQLAALVLGGEGGADPARYRDDVSRLQAEAERLEAQISAHSGEFSQREAPVTLERVQRAIPPDAALIEIVSYRPYDPKSRAAGGKFGPARYAAYVLRPAGEPAFVDLGAAAEIDDDVVEFRKALANPLSLNVKRAGRALDELVMRPVRKLLGSVRVLLLSPDSMLNLIPFSALVDENYQYLVSNYTITYLTSGRDLTRLTAQSRYQQEPVVIANPVFDLTVGTRDGSSKTATNARGRRSADMSRMQFSALKGTAREASALKDILSGAQILTDERATEAALKRVKSPRLLHIATHGFFLPDQESKANANSRGLGLSSSRSPQIENPLLRSGIALAGANKRQSGSEEDGVLTAMEASGLDLRGTQLVVLSACETGLGTVKNGDGVFGLRRALVLAGAESELMSLWQVSDDATRYLMVEYYQRLQSGEGRTESLRNVQLLMLKGERQIRDRQRHDIPRGLRRKGRADRSHPFYWASFIPIGDWKSLDGK